MQETKKREEANCTRTDKTVYSKRPSCNETNHPKESCWRAADGHLIRQKSKKADKSGDETFSDIKTNQAHQTQLHQC